MAPPDGRRKSAPAASVSETPADPARRRSVDSALSLYLSEVREIPLLTAEEEKTLAEGVARGCLESRAKLIESNLRLVVKLSRRYGNRGLPLLDIVEEGNLGLIRAAEKFRADKGCRFSTYATWWVRQAIERALVNHTHTVRLPVHVSEELDRISRYIEEVRSREGTEPGESQIAEALDFSPARVRRLLCLARATFSLDQPMGEEGDYSLYDMIVDKRSLAQNDWVQQRESLKVLWDWLQKLRPREREIVSLRYGLGGEEPKTLEEIGSLHGVTRERIRQIEMGALRKLRRMAAEECVQFNWLY